MTDQEHADWVVSSVEAIMTACKGSDGVCAVPSSYGITDEDTVADIANKVIGRAAGNRRRFTNQVRDDITRGVLEFMNQVNELNEPETQEVNS